MTQILSEFKLDDLRDFLETCGPETKVYLGCDSKCIKKAGIWYADYASVIVVHIDSKKGCKIFGEIVREPVYDKKKSHPRMRLMTEAYKVCELFFKVQDIISAFDTEIHLDINPKEKHNSSIVVQEAAGYVRSMTNVTPLLKNDAFAASFAADRFASIFANRKISRKEARQWKKTSRQQKKALTKEKT